MPLLRCTDARMADETLHLRFRPFAGDDLLALLVSEEQGEEQIGLPLAEGLRDFYVSGEASPVWLEQLRDARAANPWVHGFALVDKESNQIIGTAGFKGPPDEDGVVEIAYAIVPSFRDRGYATEAASFLFSFALADERVRVVRAHTLPSTSASTRVLTKCEFVRTGEVTDPEDGIVWRWERCSSQP
jgi:ribosomal-protein-alanine N-acetyltransferase